MTTNGAPLRRQLPQEAVPLLQEGVSLVLSRWTALQVAVESEWGGPGSRRLADQLYSDILSWFTQSSPKEPLYIDDLEGILEQGMLLLNTIPDDGSIEEVAEKLMIMHEECLESNYSSIVALREAGPITSARQRVIQVVDENGNEDNGDGNDTDEMEDELNPVNAQVNRQVQQEVQDDDGWQVVSHRRNRGRRT